MPDSTDAVDVVIAQGDLPDLEAMPTVTIKGDASKKGTAVTAADAAGVTTGPSQAFKPAGGGQGFAATHGAAATHGLTHVAAADSAVVDTDAMRAVVETGRAHISELDELVGEMQSEMAAGDGYWIGEAATWYREVFVTASKKFQKALEEYRVYTDELVSYADRYEGADSRAQQLAEGVEKPNYT